MGQVRLGQAMKIWVRQNLRSLSFLIISKVGYRLKGAAEAIVAQVAGRRGHAMFFRPQGRVAGTKCLGRAY